MKSQDIVILLKLASLHEQEEQGSLDLPEWSAGRDELKEGDTYFTEIVRQLESEGTKEARLEAMRMRRERNSLRPRCDLSDGRHRTFE